MNTNEIAHKLIDAALTDGGVTIPAPTSGLIVGGVVRPLILPRSHRAMAGEAAAREAIVEWLTEYWDGIAPVGSWLNESTGDIFIDICTVVEDAATAEVLAHERGEIAYYDIGTGETVYM